LVQKRPFVPKINHLRLQNRGGFAVVDEYALDRSAMIWFLVFSSVIPFCPFHCFALLLATVLAPRGKDTIYF
jgi:hypothetical protein